MPQIVLCGDGIETVLESDRGLGLILRVPGGDELGRYLIEACELRAVIAGVLTYQASDGKGHSLTMEGHNGGLKIRLEKKGHPAKNCRLAREEVEDALISVKIGV